MIRHLTLWSGAVLILFLAATAWARTMHPELLPAWWCLNTIVAAALVVSLFLRRSSDE